MDPNGPMNSQKQMGDQQQGGVSAQEPFQPEVAQPTSAEPQVTTAPSEPTVSQPPMGDQAPMQTAGAVDQSQQAVTSETQEEVPEQVNPIDTSAQPTSTIPTVGDVPPLGENGGNNNPPQSA